MDHARFDIAEVTREKMVLHDLGPWREYKAITNDAEGVVAYLSRNLGLGKRRLFYYGSEGCGLTEIIHEDGKFLAFRAPGRRYAIWPRD
jgi:hypothetical protein